MSKLPVISGKECIKALEKDDFEIIRRRGSHVILSTDRSLSGNRRMNKKN